MRKKAVGIIDYIGLKGGHYYYSLCLLNSLEAKGINTFYFSNLGSSDFSKTTCVKLFHRDLKKNLLGVWQLFSGTVQAIAVSKKNKVRTHIFHVFEASLINCLILFLLKVTGFKTIVIVHDIKSFDFAETNWVRRLQYNRLADELVVHNQYSLSAFKETFPQLETPIRVIAHGGHVEVISPLDKEFARVKLGLDKNRKYLLFFGQIKKTKGLDVLLEALPKTPNLTLIIAGKPWRDDFSDYQDIIERRGIKEQLKLVIRYIEDDEKDLFYNAADFVVLPYREIYQSGVLLMSMSYGRPVIASDLPPNQAIVSPGENGLLFKNGDQEDLSSVLERAMELDAFAMGGEASETIRKNFDWDQISESYIPLLKD